MACFSERAWTTVIQDHVQSESWQFAFSTFWKMQENRVLPSTFTFVALLKACVSLKDVGTGRSLHAQIVHMGLERDLHVGRMLLRMYVECGCLAEARHIFADLPLKNVVSWNTLISGYAEHGPHEEAFRCFEKMQSEGVSPNEVTTTSLVKLCATSGAFDKGRDLHEMLNKSDSELGLSIGNTFISMYGKCGSLLEAQEVFDKLQVRNVVSWTALITGYTEHGPAEKAVALFKEMRHDDILPNEFTFSCILKACGSTGDLEEGQRVHTEVAREEYESNATVGNSLIGLYAKTASLREAHEVFDELGVRDVVSWTALIAGYAEHGPGEEALKTFNLMQQQGILGDAVTYACSLKACNSLGAVEKGLLLHAEIGQEGFERDLTIGNTLISMYASFSLLSEAEDVFNTLPARSVVSWTALISGYAEHGSAEAVLSCFDRMQLEGVSPNAATYCSVLKACGSTRAIKRGRRIHDQITKRGLERDDSIGTTLIGMYAKCGLLSIASYVFDNLQIQEVTAWTAMIAGCAEYGFDQEALDIFAHLHCLHIFSTSITYVCALKACGNMGALDKALEYHMEVLLKGFEAEPSVNNSVISAYSKCGAFQEARGMFDSSPTQDVVAWTALIKGYVVNNEEEMAMESFWRMLSQGIRPDAVTFICLLTACSHASMVFEGEDYFKAMEGVFDLAPTFEHLNCMVDLLARSGHLHEAGTFLKMSCPVLRASWLSMLSTCKIFGDQEMAGRCLNQLLELDPADISHRIMNDVCANNDQ